MAIKGSVRVLSRALSPARLGIACVTLSASGAFALAQVPLTTVDLLLPSDGAGPGGTLAVRLTFPSDPADYRFPDGAPVTVYLPGGFAAGGLGASPRLAEQGFVMVTFLYPGGVQGAFHSDGVYDFRGDDCQRALRDVIRFAEGVATDTLGRTIDDVVPGSVHAGIVGLAPFSNGLIGLVTLDRYGAEIPFAPFQVGWENPTNGQIITGDLGTTRQDCDPNLDTDGNGMPGDDAKNPWFDPDSGYGPATFEVDLSALEFDPFVPNTFTDPTTRCAPAVQSGAVFHDGLLNGRLDFDPSRPNCLDYDGDGILERTEDFRLGGVTTFSPSCALKVYYAPEVTRALEDLGVFGPGWPAWIATPSEADLFWPLRDATVHWDGIAARFPRFRAMTVFTKQDHVQSQDDHPHVRQVLDGMASHSLWYRLNADAAYYLAVNGGLPAGYVETPANAAIPAGLMKSRAEPRNTASDGMSAAGHAEMADRIHAGCWWPDVGSTMRPAGNPAPEAQDLVFAADAATLAWTPAAGAFCYDVLRGDTRGLREDDSTVHLDGAACVEDDSSDAASADTAAPAPGEAFYYVVRPNGLHGTYGASSRGRTRNDTEGACFD